MFPFDLRISPGMVLDRLASKLSQRPYQGSEASSDTTSARLSAASGAPEGGGRVNKAPPLTAAATKAASIFTDVRRLDVNGCHLWSTTTIFCTSVKRPFELS